MAITYVATPFVRPAGVAKLPLILRNPQNDNTKKDYLKDGPSYAYKFGPADYRMWYEALTDQTGALTNYWNYATSVNGYTWVKDGNNGAMDPLDSPSWEKGEICPDSLFWDVYDQCFKMYYHGGSNAGPRQIGLMTSTTALPGSWTRANSSNPVLANGGSGAIDENGVADGMVVRRSLSDFRMIYKAFDSGNVSRTAYATSTDGISWTKYASNPILDLGSGNDGSGAFGGWFYEDALGRVHLWYCGKDGAGFQRILYAYSDNWTSWTRDQTDVMLARSGTGSDPDADQIGDVIRAFHDDGILFFTCMNFNFSAYTGDALGRLEGRGLYWIPKQATSTPTRPGRAVRPIVGSGRQYLSVPTGAALLGQGTAFSIWCDFKMPPGNTFRYFYGEYVAFNKQVWVAVNTTGKIEVMYRTAAGIVNYTGGSRRDDNVWHRVRFVRTGASAFEAFCDNESLGTSSTAAGSDATAPTYFNLCGLDPGNTDMGPIGEYHGCGAVMRRVVTIAGYAMTDAEDTTLWNNGEAGGAAPSGGTLKLNLRLGSGGSAGPDVDDSGNAYSCTVTGAVMVDAALATDQLPTLPFILTT